MPDLDDAEHRFPRSGSAHGCCGKCLACPTCEPELVAEPCAGDPDWLRMKRSAVKQEGANT